MKRQKLTYDIKGGTAVKTRPMPSGKQKQPKSIGMGMKSRKK